MWELETDPDVEIVIGSRVQMLGRDTRHNWRRHYLGRVAATAVSVMLRLRVYDTQCGAKLFRAGATVGRVFLQPFLTRWIFDVEILSRWLLAQPRGTGRETLEDGSMSYR